MQDHRERWRTAVHEAGHVIAAALGNVPIRSVTIVPDDECRGQMIYEAKALRSGCLAGAAAELALLGEVSDCGRLENDRVGAAALGPLTRPVWRAVCRQMRLHRQKVRAVAVALIGQPTLGVADLYDRVLPPHFPGIYHPARHLYEESIAEWAARMGADQWEPDEAAEDTLRPPSADQQAESDLSSFI